MGIIIVYAEDMGGNNIKELADRIENELRTKFRNNVEVNFIHTGRLLPEERALKDLNEIISKIENGEYDYISGGDNR